MDTPPPPPGQIHSPHRVWVSNALMDLPHHQTPINADRLIWALYLSIESGGAFPPKANQIPPPFKRICAGVGLSMDPHSFKVIRQAAGRVLISK